MALLAIRTERKRGMDLVEKVYTGQTNTRVISIARSALASYLLIGTAYGIGVLSFQDSQNRWHTWACVLLCWRSISRRFLVQEKKGCLEAKKEEG